MFNKQLSHITVVTIPGCGMIFLILSMRNTDVMEKKKHLDSIYKYVKKVPRYTINSSQNRMTAMHRRLMYVRHTMCFILEIKDKLLSFNI